jgi:hypothetical protein
MVGRDESGSKRTVKKERIYQMGTDDDRPPATRRAGSEHSKEDKMR